MCAGLSMCGTGLGDLGDSHARSLSGNKEVTSFRCAFTIWIPGAPVE